MRKEGRRNRKIKLILLSVFILLVAGSLILWNIERINKINNLVTADLLASNPSSYANHEVEMEIIGILHIGTGMCGTTCDTGNSTVPLNYRLNRIPMLGDIKSKDDGKLAIIHGRVIVSSVGVPWGNTGDTLVEYHPRIELINYRVLSNKDYHDLLVYDSERHIAKTYGCAFSHSKDFRWEKENNNLYAVVRWSYFNGKGEVENNRYADVYYTLQGNFVRLEDHNNGTRLCL